MQEVNSLWEMLQRYFQSDVVLTVIIGVFPWLLKSLSKKQKIYISGILIALVLCFNKLVFWMMNKVGEGETYYRLLWILPLGCIFSIILIKIWDILRTSYQKILYVFILCIGFFIYSSGTIDDWLKPDLYCLSEETLEVADMIDAHSHYETAKVLSYSDIITGIRQYNANMILVDETVDSSLGFMFKYNLGNVSGLILSAQIHNLGVEYICFEKEKNISEMALLSSGATLIGETENYRICYYDEEEQNKIWEAIGTWELEMPITGLEYVTLPGIDSMTRFGYYADGHITLVDESLEAIESYMTETSEIKFVEFQEYVVCAVDNADGSVSEETVAIYEEIIKQNKPIILLLSKPIPSENLVLEKSEDSNWMELQQKIMAEDSLVAAIYTTGYHTANKELLEDRIMQCVCIPTDARMGVLINVKGE